MPEKIAQFGEGLAVQGVQRFFAVDGDDGDAVGNFDLEVFVIHRVSVVPTAEQASAAWVDF